MFVHNINNHNFCTNGACSQSMLTDSINFAAPKSKTTSTGEDVSNPDAQCDSELPSAMLLAVCCALDDVAETSAVGAISSFAAPSPDIVKQ